MADETTTTEKKPSLQSRAGLVIKPVYSSKSGELAKSKKYVFQVALKANKAEIKKEVEKRFGVKVAQVNTIKVEGKARTFGRFAGKTKDYKKAVVTLTESSKAIELFTTN